MNRTVSGLSAALLLLAGCSGQSGGEAPFNGSTDFSGPDGGPSACEVVSRTELGPDEKAPSGFSARDMLDLSEGVHRETLRYEDGSGQSGLRLTVTYIDGTVLFVDREVAAQTAAPSSSCGDTVEVTITARFVTDDGRFDEEFDAVLTAVQKNENGYFVELDPASLNGSFTFEDFDARQYDRRRLFIDAVFSASGSRGRVSGQGENNAGSPNPESQASATYVPVGQW